MRTVRPLHAALRTAASLALAACAFVPAFAQTPAAPAPAAETPLPIATPPGAQVQVQMDIHEADLLGVVKSALRGFAFQSARSAAVDKTQPNGAAQSVLASADLDGITTDTLKNITHVHFLTFQYPGSVAQAAVPKSHDAAAALLSSLPDQTAFYANAFAQEGGSPLFSSNQNGTHVILDGFAPGKGFALAAQSPAGVAVLRVNGYPDFTRLGALLAQLKAASQAIPAAR